MNYDYTNRVVETTSLSHPPSYSQAYQPFPPPPPTSYSSSVAGNPYPNLTQHNPIIAYRNDPPNYDYQNRPLPPSQSRESLTRVRASYPDAQQRYYGPSPPSGYGTVPRHYTTDGTASNNNNAGGENASHSSSPRNRYRTPDDYHYDYRGGFRPIQDTESRDGYTTDGSGSGYRDGSVRGFENFRYPEREGLLAGQHPNPFFATHSNGTSYAKGEGEKQPFLGGVEPVRLTPS